MMSNNKYNEEKSLFTVARTYLSEDLYKYTLAITRI